MTKRNTLILAVAFAVLTAAVILSEARGGEREDRIRNDLQEFKSDPAEFMAKPPARSASGHSLPVNAEDRASWTDRSAAEIDRLEGMAKKQPIHALVAPGRDDLAADLVDELKVSTLEDMESGHLRAARLAEHPWSSTYWPIAKGITAWRYADPAFPNSLDWKRNSDYLLDPANSCSIANLSPAEKYDLLVGDERETLTHENLNEGEAYYSANGTVEPWMGICHGWSPASFMDPRPTHGVTVLAADGRTEIPFTPSDLKGLASLLWANGRFENRFIGERCDDKNPPTDENGRITETSCYGENPGTWHLAVVNQIGVSRRSFIMDALHDTDIWNQPIYAYQYSYFNPKSSQPVDTLAAAEVSLADLTADPFKAYRSPQARSVVGIAMDLTYVSETAPSAQMTDGPEDDALVTVHYLYDLEIDADRQIIGGEWYSNAHPGFLWTPARNAHPISVGDAMLPPPGEGEDWTGAAPIPASWKRAVVRASAKGEPLARIVDTLEVLATLP